MHSDVVNSIPGVSGVLAPGRWLKPPRRALDGTSFPPAPLRSF